ncbi:MAG: MucBP domain-containing protein [Firmicutes bacterium]|nr:MucBP domain-containing protein [Bacillota bacterium]
MKKKIIALLLATLLVVLSYAAVYADHLKGKEGWEVELNASEEVVSTFDSDEIADAFSNLQPGDDLTLTVKVKNTSDKEVDWYILNQVVHSLEDNSKNNASGGSYTYVLSYVDSKGNDNELYNSERVGGESADSKAPEGLHGADSALKDYLYLERMAPKGEGTVTLFIALEGETQGNSYQETLADLQMRFAVELVPDRKIITGDSGKDLSKVYIGMCVSGIALLVLGLVSLAGDKKKKKIKNTAAMLLIFALLFAAMPQGIFAADNVVTYHVRVYAGNPSIGKLTVGDGKVYEEDVAYGQTFSFDLKNNVEIVNKEYFAKGIRESGKDNSTYNATSFKIVRDIDYVVAYGMESTAVTYTVNYVDENGNPLMESATFYGNVGDKPVVAFKYHEGYQPQAYNLTKTLSADPDENVFTFEYTEIPETQTIVIPGGPAGPAGQQGGQQGGEQQEGQQGGEQQGGDNVNPNPNPNPDTNPEPVDIIDIDPPLAPGEPAWKSWPAWVWAAGGAGIVGLIAIPIIIIAKRRKDDDDDEDEE